jgi:hypothetical protein
MIPRGVGLVFSVGIDILVIFRDNDARMWRSFRPDQIEVLGSPKALPKWTKGRHGRGRKGHTKAVFPRGIAYASVGGERPEDVATYYTRKSSGAWGVRQARKNYTKFINNRIARLVDDALKGTSEKTQA